MVIAHTGIKTTREKHAAVAAFYEAALAPLGYKKTRVFLDGDVNGFSDLPGGIPADWWISVAQEGTPLKSHHAFVAKGMSPSLFLIFVLDHEKNIFFGEMEEIDADAEQK